MNRRIPLKETAMVVVTLGVVVLAVVLALSEGVARPVDGTDAFGAAPETAAPVAPAPAARVVDVRDYQIGGRTDSQAIQAAIDAADNGDTVYFPGGKYNLDKPFHFGSGVNHVGDPTTPAVLVGRGRTSLLLRHTPSEPLHGTTIRGLQFDNVELNLSGARSYTSFSDITLKDCVFRNGRRATPWSSDYVWLAYTVGVTVDGCTFLRDSRSGGRGLVLERTHGSVVKDSFFGTTRNLEDGAPYGYFRTAINLTGYDEQTKLRNEDVVIDGNVWRRNERAPCPVANRSLCEDHGVYVWGARGVDIRNNYGDGWTNSGTGGAVKLRNSDDVFVVGNHFMGSGVLAHTHWHSVPRHLSHVYIANNRIDVRGNNAPASGIVYWRSADDRLSKGSFCRAARGEDDIVIAGNEFVDGGNVDVRCADGREFCVEGNAGARLLLQVPYVRRSRCTPPAAWDRPLGGVHRGDLNGDGKEDFVQQARLFPSGSRYWRAHLSVGDGFSNAGWGDKTALAPDAGRFGPQVGDFNGDGLDDVAYHGACGTARSPCWRVHHSTGTGFAAPVDYGSEGRYSAETFRFGMHVGDYNGDGRDDIAFRGVCGTGSGSHPCWSVLASRRRDAFRAVDWGEDTGVSRRWTPAETDEFGFLVGDFNGDGSDDLAYRGLCGSALTPCLRVHQSTGGDAFLARSWGDEYFPDGRSTAHFGMRVGDSNGDRKADIAYRGRCGGDGAARWRYHLGGPHQPFTVACSGSLDF